MTLLVGNVHYRWGSTFAERLAWCCLPSCAAMFRSRDPFLRLSWKRECTFRGLYLIGR
ncbi:MAG: hypothetical protein ACI856_000398 [Kiritimatiellia bacterium]|jgi:hypothetical protein